jgi:hypothetical protein
VYILARPAINRNTFKDVHWLWDLSRKSEAQDQPKQIVSICVVLAIRKVQSATLTALLPSWIPLSDRILRQDDIGSRLDRTPHSATIAVIDGVRSIEDFTDRFRSVINELEQGQQSHPRYRRIRAKP